MAVRVLLPGMPGTNRSDRLTVHDTVTDTLAGCPSGAPNWPSSGSTCGVQCRPAWASSAPALSCAAACAPASVRAREAGLAASLAAASTAPCAMVVRPAPIIRPIRAITIGARMMSSSGALPASRSLRAAGRRLIMAR